MRKVILFILSMTILLRLSTAVVYAAVPAGVGNTELSASFVPQAKSNWCWAASAENAIIWELTPTRTQWDAVYHIKGWLLNPYPDTAGSIFDSRDAAEYISRNKLNYSAAESAFSYPFIYE